MSTLIDMNSKSARQANWIIVQSFLQHLQNSVPLDYDLIEQLLIKPIKGKIQAYVRNYSAIEVSWVFLEELKKQKLLNNLPIHHPYSKLSVLVGIEDKELIVFDLDALEELAGSAGNKVPEFLAPYYIVSSTKRDVTDHPNRDLIAGHLY